MFLERCKICSIGLALHEWTNRWKIQMLYWHVDFRWFYHSLCLCRCGLWRKRQLSWPMYSAQLGIILLEFVRWGRFLRGIKCFTRWNIWWTGNSIIELLIILISGWDFQMLAISILIVEIQWWFFMSLVMVKSMWN